MIVILEAILAYLINIASGERSAAIAASRERKLKQVLEREDKLKKALESTHSLSNEVGLACAKLARARTRLGVTPKEEPIWRLLSDDAFQDDMAEWLMAGAMEEGNAAKDRLLHAMELALSSAGGDAEQIAFLKTGYFDSLEKAVFANPILARWRHQLSLDYLRHQVAALRQHAEEAAGLFSPAKQQDVLSCYCEKALAAWDIIDLSNLPEGDIHMATQKLLLRQLYMPLRIEVEAAKQGEDDEAVLSRIEEEREARRHREAGHLAREEVERLEHHKARLPVGKRLAASRRLVVLGDPGGGKTTMLRWMATAYLLRYKGDTAFSQIPDTQSLPAHPWIPVLIRCRDLGEADLCRCFTDFLTQHLNKTELLPEEAEVMRAVILDRIAKGEALLLVDGLDEITNPQVRMMFCQELERTAVRYPDASIIVTSRIVGYRDMPYRMGSGFQHGQIAELSREDKDLFAQRWVEVTEQNQSKEEKAKRVQELIDALHSNDRIERLTGNPMLLTTLALVKRKVGKLPNKRTKLYAEAVSVLLNWNPRHYQTIEEDEAIPQLEYLAYEMCRRGVQRLEEDEVLDLLDKLRIEYPNIRSIKRRDPHTFLKHLEERSSILIKSGGIWLKSAKKEKVVWEFRHLTFQEYLAARALLDGRYPGRGKSKSLAGEVAPLARVVQKAKSNDRRVDSNEEVDVPESWREALRLLVADCKDDDVDDALLAILRPMRGEKVEETARPRAVLAGLCLADEPNVSPEVAGLILKAFSKSVQDGEGLGGARTSLERAAIELASSIWSSELKRNLIEEFICRPADVRESPGGVWSMAEVANWSRLSESSEVYSKDLLRRIKSNDPTEIISAALTIMEVAYEGTELQMEHFVEPLSACLRADRPIRHAAAWAFMLLTRNQSGLFRFSQVVPALCEAIQNVDVNEGNTEKFIIHALGNIGDPIAVRPILSKLDGRGREVRVAVINSLGKLGDQEAVAPLLPKLDDEDPEIRLAVISALEKLGDQQVIDALLLKLDDEDPRIRKAAIAVLGNWGDQRFVALLLGKLEDQNADTRYSVIAPLGTWGGDGAVIPLLAKLEDQESKVRFAAISALGQLKDIRAIEPLLAKIDDQDPIVRHSVITALGEIGGDQIVLPLLSKLDDEDSDVRHAVITALEQFGNDQVVVPLLSKLDDEDSIVRHAAIAALGRSKNNLAVAPLLARLDDKDSSILHFTIEALGRLGDQRATEALLVKLDDQDGQVRHSIIVALGQLGDKRAVMPLLTKLEDQNWDVRQAGLEALGRLGDGRAVEPLLAKLEDQDWDVRQAGIEALGVLGDGRAVEPLLAKLDDKDSEVQVAVINALGLLGNGGAVVPLLTKLEDPNFEIREAAIAAFARLGNKRAVAPLLTKLNDPNEQIGAAAAAALHALGEPNHLPQFLDSAYLEVRQAAVRAYAHERNLLEQKLLTRDLDAAVPWLDPKLPVSDELVNRASRHLKIPVEEIRLHYEILSVDLGLCLSWK